MEGNMSLYQKLERKFSIFRWVLILFVAPITIPLSEYHSNNQYFIYLLILGSLYVLLITIAAYSSGKKFNFLLKYTMYFDIPLISMVIFLRGGLRSDTYLLYYLIILYDGAKFGFRGTIYSLAQCILYFTIASLLASPIDTFEINRYAIRVIYLISLTFVMYEVNLLISESHSNEKFARELAYKDPLTQLPNRLLMADYFDKMRNQFELTGQSFSIVVIDIDNFKQINDTKGHAFGDKVLQLLANIFTDYLKDGDFICRFGGEEFLAFLTDSEVNILDRVNEIRNIIEASDFYGEKITVSIGINNLKNEFTMIENISLADEAMYAVKKSGKNKVLQYEDLVLINK